MIFQCSLDIYNVKHNFKGLEMLQDVFMVSSSWTPTMRFVIDLHDDKTEIIHLFQFDTHTNRKFSFSILSNSL